MQLGSRDDERITVVGLQGSGKSTWTHAYIRAHLAAGHKVLVFDPMKEYGKIAGATVYQPKASGGDALRQEFETMLYKLVILPYKRNRTQPYRLLVCEEASRYLMHGKPLPDNIGWINDTMRHMHISLVCIARRFVQLNVDLPELSHRLIIYRQSGVNDMRRLADISEGLDDAVRSLAKYHYVEVDAERRYEIRPPVHPVS